jgi:formylglycine-generating enzyme required for sulfatase activity
LAEATAYADWLSEKTGKPYRLPTLEESQATALAGAETEFWWGGTFEGICARANAADVSFAKVYPDDKRPLLACEDTYPHTSPVTAFAPNPLGLYDTVGNVWEWTNSCFKGDCSNAIFRGAAWATPFPRHFKRDGQWQDRILLKNSGVGFRVMRDAE